MRRRGFLGAILAAGVAPVFVPNAVARGIWMPVREIVRPEGGYLIPAHLAREVIDVFINGARYKFDVPAISQSGNLISLKRFDADRGEVVIRASDTGLEVRMPARVYSEVRS